MGTILSVKNLTAMLGAKVLLKDVSLDVGQGQITAIAGGSGSGKTTIGLSILRLLPPGLSISSGNIIFEGVDLCALPLGQMRRCRGSRIGMVFQDALAAFNPLLTVGRQIEEVLAAHSSLSAAQRRKRSLEALADAELPDPQRIYANYPHQLSGGMRQRAMIAQALACGPSLIIADEPTSSLDVTLQVKIMDLFRRLKKERGLSVLLIAHDLGMVAHLADEVVILKGGQVIEAGLVQEVMHRPQQAYTRQLIEAFQ